MTQTARPIKLLMLMAALLQVSACVTDRSAKPMQPATTKFDGTWNALMTSNQPPCPESFQYVVTVKNGELSGTVPGKLNDYNLGGRVMADGSVKDMEASSAERRMTFKGKFMDSVAEGTFYTFGVTTDCGGTFKYARQK